MNIKHIIRQLFLFLLIMAGIKDTLFAQQPQATAALGESVILIGDQTSLRLEITVPSGTYVVWPEIRDTIIRQIEVIRSRPVDTIMRKESGDMVLMQEITITSFDSGYFAIPPFIFAYKIEGKNDYQATETEAMLLEVHTPEVDMEEDIKDITSPLKVPVTFAELWPWLLGIVVIGAAIGFLIYYLKKRKSAQPLIQIRKKPVLPPHQVAFEELEKLRAKKLWQSGKIKQYHTELTDIVRTYIQSKFNIRASELVTSEILEELEKIQLPPETLSKTRQMLELADLVKFAKEHPLPEDEERSMNYAIDFVKDTIHLMELSAGADIQQAESGNTR